MATETITEDELNKTIRKAASEAARAATSRLKDDEEEELYEEEGYESDSEDDDYEDDEDDLPMFSSRPKNKFKTVEDIKRSISDQDEFDIFDDIGEELAKAGTFITYSIYKGGKYFTTEEHPYSWDRLQKERGEGHYKVVAKDQNKRYIKAQSRVLAATPEDKRVHSNLPNASASKEGPSTVEILAMLKEGSREAKEEARREAREQREQFQQMLTSLQPKKDNSDLIIQMMANNSKENMAMLTNMVQALRPREPKDNSATITQMMMEMQKTNMQMMQQMQNQTSQLIEKMNEKFERGLERVAQLASHEPVTPEFDAWKVMEIQKQAEERGERRMKDLFDLVELKADEKAKFMSDKEPESTTEMILKNLIPMIGQVALSSKGVLPPSAPNPVMSSAPRRSVSQPTAPMAQKRALPQPRSQEASRSAQRTTANQQGTAVRSGNRQGAQTSNGSILDQIGDETPSKPSNNAERANQAPRVASNSTQKVERSPETATITNDENRDKIISLVLPLLVESVSSGKGFPHIPEIVDESLVLLYQNGVHPATIERDVTPAVIEAMIQQYGLPEDFSLLLREYYEKLVLRAREIGQNSRDQEASIS
jgi:hypothetical protein